MTKEIVIAAYDKDISWVNQLNPDVKRTIYRKGKKTDGMNEIFIETNLGRCVHSFFNHIYMNYDNLSDYTFFAQDFPFDHWENLVGIINSQFSDDFVYRKLLSTTSSLTIGGYYGYHNNTIPRNKVEQSNHPFWGAHSLQYGSMWDMSDSRQFGIGKVLSCFSNGSPQHGECNLDVDKYWDILFDCHRPGMYEFIPGGHFGITKEHVRLRSRDLYKKVVDLLVDDVTAPWMIERLECYIFDPTRFKTKL